MRQVKLFCLCVAGMLTVSSIKAQVTPNNNGKVVSIGGVELGLKNGFFYEQALTRSFSLRGSLGYGVEFGATFHNGFAYSGIRPVATLSPRWYYSISKGSAHMLNVAPYITLDVSYSPATGSIHLPKRTSSREQWAFCITPAWGTSFEIAPHLLCKMQVGIMFGYAQLYKSFGIFDQGWRSKNEVTGDIGFGYVF